MAVAIQTVTGAIGLDELAVTLTHEHVLIDASTWCHPPFDDSERSARIASEPVRMEFLSDLRYDPFLSPDNCVLSDIDLAAAEVSLAAEAGISTIVDPTNIGLGRRPESLRDVAQSSGVNIIMGSGYYLHTSHPPGLADRPLEDIAEEIISDVSEGVGDTGIRAGVIGEIGVSAHFTEAEQKVLRAASRAQRATGVPLIVHMPGWERYGQQVLDVVGEEGCRLDAVVLGHMNPSGSDLDYQESLIARGAYLGFDMIGMDYFYADQTAQSPHDELVSEWVARLIRRGNAARLLLSSDVYLKMMLVAYGGNGYAHTITRFLPRLARLGIDDGVLKSIMTSNSRTLFEAAAESGE